MKNNIPNQVVFSIQHLIFFIRYFVIVPILIISISLYLEDRAKFLDLKNNLVSSYNRVFSQRSTSIMHFCKQVIRFCNDSVEILYCFATAVFSTVNKQNLRKLYFRFIVIATIAYVLRYGVCPLIYNTIMMFTMPFVSNQILIVTALVYFIMIYFSPDLRLFKTNKLMEI